MTNPNVVAFPVRHKSQSVSEPTPSTTEYDEHGWLEISVDVYEWFTMHPNEHAPVHEYGFLHQPTRRAFIMIGRLEADEPLCAMSNRPYTDDEFALLRTDEVIDSVIERLGYEPINER
jgi:hypothetical protein